MPLTQLHGTVQPDWESLVRCILRQGTPARVHVIELFLDPEVQDAVCQRFDLLDGLDPVDPTYDWKRQVRIQRFLGYDFVRCGIDVMDMPLHRVIAQDTAGLARAAGRQYIDEHRGPITSWDEFEAYPDILTAGLVEPPLTTLAAPVQDMGAVAMQML